VDLVVVREVRPGDERLVEGVEGADGRGFDLGLKCVADGLVEGLNIPPKMRLVSTL
jgi:hypothetical protein